MWTLFYDISSLADSYQEVSNTPTNKGRWHLGISPQVYRRIERRLSPVAVGGAHRSGELRRAF